MLKKHFFLTFLLVISSFVLILIAQDEELPKTGRYQIVPEESKLQIHTGTAGVFGFMGHGHTMVPKVFSGEMELNPQNPVPATVTLRIDAKSLHETADFKPEEKAIIEKELHQDVLETTKYPEIIFQSTGVRYKQSPGHVFDVQIDGDLTMHGVTKRITVPARILDTGPNLRVSGKVKIDRREYNIEPQAAAGGTVKVDKNLEVSFELVLLPQ
jgi:polyisoprenoid-binding protein YceI